MNTRVQVPFQGMIFSEFMLKSAIAGSYGSSIFSFLKNLHTILCSGCLGIVVFKVGLCGEFPGGPVVRTSCFHCKEHVLHSWSGN